MRIRRLLFFALSASHAAAALFAPDALLPAVAASVYLPLMALHAVGVPVLHIAESGGWFAPLSLGYAIVGILWLAVWWAVAWALSRAWSTWSGKGG